MSGSASSPKHWLIIPAAGIGSRMGGSLPKQYLEIRGKTILQRTLEALCKDTHFESVLVGLSPDDSYFSKLTFNHPNLETFIGGDERAATVLNGLERLASRASENDWVWVHDAARPLVSKDELSLLKVALRASPDGALLALKSVDTIKQVTDSGKVTTLDRNAIWRAQTPQVFPFEVLKSALNQSIDDGFAITDESYACERAGFSPTLVPGKSSNVKVTVPDDLFFVEQHLFTEPLNVMTKIPLLRVGSGYDVHAFEAGDHVIIGGVRIPYTQGLKAHSDGDVLLHALCDALLGALALGDIGHHFPDTDPKWSGADSRALLRGVNDLIEAKGFHVENLDTTIIAQAPKMAPYVDEMRAVIAADLGIDVDRVSVKATTTERLGFTGRKEGIACRATALLVNHDV